MTNAKNRKTEIITVSAMKDIYTEDYVTWDNDDTAESVVMSDGIDYTDRRFLQEKLCVEDMSKEEMVAQWEEEGEFEDMTEEEKQEEIEERTRELWFPEDFIFENVQIKVTYPEYDTSFDPEWSDEPTYYSHWEQAFKNDEKVEFEFVK
jgi:hypothetical protein